MSRRPFSRVTMFLVLLPFLLALAACGGSTEPPRGADTGGPADLSGAAEAEVVADVGAVLTTGNGISAVIPPGALPEDMAVSLIPVRPPADGRSVAAARLEPEGTVLLKPITIRLPLPADWSAGDTPIVFEFLGDDPSEAVPTSAYAEVSGTAGHYVAEVLISHFSGPICARNCHAGTIRHLIQQFGAEGCTRDSLLAAVRRGYPGVEVSDEDCGRRGPEAAQAFLDTYFDDLGGYNADYEVPASVMTQLADYVRSGRQVVLAFKQGQWGERSGPHRFLPSGANEFSHTAPLELIDGQIYIKNTLATENEKLIEMLGGENVARYPFDQLREFRRLPSGAAVEIAACGSPGCLSDPARNPWGEKLFEPVDGVSYVGRAWSNPWEYARSFGQGWSGIPPRGIPWNAVRIYVEKDLTGEGTVCAPSQFFNAHVVLNDALNTQFDGVSIIAAFAEMNNVSGYPTIFASEAEVLNTLTVFSYDFVSLTFNKALTGPGSYALSPWPQSPWSAVLAFASPSILNARGGEPTAFASMSGTVTLEEYGPSLGSRIKGTFEAALEGTQSVLVDGEFVNRDIAGTITGSFNVILANPPEAMSLLPLGYGRPVTVRLR